MDHATPVDLAATGSLLQLSAPGKSSGDYIAAMADKIDDILAANKWAHAFIRMSIRSPKDAAISSPKFKTIFDKEFAALQDLYGCTPLDSVSFGGADLTSEMKGHTWLNNLRLIACYRASTYAMAVTNGSDGLELLCKSRRIQGDMQSLLTGEYVDGFQVCIREYRFFDVCFEFRAFIYKGVMTGLTQYNELCFFPELARFKMQIQAKVEAFTARVIAAMNMENMVSHHAQ